MERNRLTTWWITWEDLNWPDIDNMEKIKSRAAAIAKANVNAVILFGAHFRWDWMPFFPLLHDYIATVVQQLHSYGIKVYDHHSVNLVHRHSTRDEMLHVMRDSLPHLPFSPTWEAAATWQYKGKYLNDWRMMDVKTGKPLYLPQYTGEGFCHRNPEFKQAYFDYVQMLIRDTGIDGLSADDAMYYAHYNACGCEHCRAELKKRTGIDLPPAEDTNFWGNWENPAWRAWLDLRFDATGDFYRELRATLPEGFMLTGCGGSSASAGALQGATDSRRFLDGCNYVNLEMSGNTPPYRHDPKTVNIPIGDRVANASHHQAAAREKGVHAFSNAYCHTIPSANVAWSVIKLLGADAWLGTLKARLGLPRSILATLPDSEDIIGPAFTFEKEHQELFDGEFLGQLAVYFSYETRNHTMSGNLYKGYPMDYSNALMFLFREGICAHTVFEFPKDANTYPVVVLSGVSRMTDDEQTAAKAYLAAGGKIVAVGPSALPGCDHNWKLPTRVDLPAEEFYTFVPEGDSWVKQPQWLSWEIPTSEDGNVWSEPMPGLYYNPQRICQEANNGELLNLCRKYLKQLPIRQVEAEGYLSTVFETEDRYVMHVLAEDYDVDIDHELDKMRYHRSRVNYVNHVEPINISGKLVLEADSVPQVYLPFSNEPAKVEKKNGRLEIALPDKTFYAILSFSKN